MSNGAGKPKPAFFIAVLAVVAGLVGLALYRCKAKKSGGGQDQPVQVDPNIVKKPAGSEVNAENPDPNAPATTVKEYEFEPATKRPEVPGTASYKALDKQRRVVRFAVNTWAGWAPIIWANHGHKAGKTWKDGKGGEFQVELVLADDP